DVSVSSNRSPITGRVLGSGNARSCSRACELVSVDRVILIAGWDRATDQRCQLAESGTMIAGHTTLTRGYDQPGPPSRIRKHFYLKVVSKPSATTPNGRYFSLFVLTTGI